MTDAAPEPARTAPLVVLCATWESALAYATKPGHTTKPRVVRQDGPGGPGGPGGPQWAIHVRVACGPSTTRQAAQSRAQPRATDPDPRAFWKLVRER